MTTAATIARGLGARWNGRNAMCRCPAHKDGTPSLSLSQTRDGRPLVHCFAGCDQISVIDALMRADLWPRGELERDPAAPHRITTKPDGLDGEERRQRAKAQAIWKQHRKITGTLAEAYLRSRAITGALPDCLGFIPEQPFWYVPEATPENEDPRPICLGRWPALVAALAVDTEVLAVQITYLDPSTARKAEIVAPDTGELLKIKKVRGPMEASAVRLRAPHDTLGLAEGVETALSAHLMYRIPTWAVTGVRRLKLVAIPESVETVVIFRDAGAVGQHVANEAWQHYDAQGYRTMIVAPDEPFGDFNDWLQAGAKEAA